MKNNVKTFIFTASLLSMLLLTLSPVYADGMATVSGYIFYSDGATPIPDIPQGDINVTTQTPFTYRDASTDETGFYSQIGATWSFTSNSTIVVTVWNQSTGEIYGTNSGIATDGVFVQNITINVTTNLPVPPPQITITSPKNKTIADSTPDLNYTIDKTSNTTYNWDGEGNISGCRLCTSFNTIYGETVLDANTSLLMHFNEYTGNKAYDDSSYNNDGTIYGANWTIGKFGFALKFDGQDDYVLVKDSDSLDITDEITLAAWVHPENFAIFNVIMTKGSWDASITNYELYLSNLGELCFEFYSGNWRFVCTNESLALNTWSHVAATFNTSYNVGLYINGDLKDGYIGAKKTETLPYPMLTNNYPLLIGQGDFQWFGKHWFNGGIDEVHILDRALNASEIAKEYNKSLSEGPHHVTVYANDTYGNLSSSKVYFTVNTSMADEIDIGPDALNLKSKGKWITAYIELPLGYDVNDINISTILLGIVPAELKPTEVGDYDNDSIPDLMVKFDREAVATSLSPGDKVKVTIRLALNDGTIFSGTDTIKVK